MTLLSVSGVATSFACRADGMRVKKTKGSDVTQSYYDGQMPVEEDSVVSGTSTVTRNFVGARGIEAIFTTTTSGTTTAFPLYDCHGNMVATVARSGPGFTTSNVRTYDVWGGVRTGASTGGAKGRYVANLGHVQDDESGLIYMRARYYEPESGRFISEDPARDGGNWFVYVDSNPMNKIDADGKIAWDAVGFVGILLIIASGVLMSMGLIVLAGVLAIIGAIVTCVGVVMSIQEAKDPDGKFQKPLREGDHGIDAWERELDEMHLNNRFNQLKQDGSIMDKLMLHQLETLYWLSNVNN